MGEEIDEKPKKRGGRPKLRDIEKNNASLSVNNPHGRAGKKRGYRKKKTQETIDKVTKTGITPLEYLTSVYRSPVPPEIQSMIDEGEVTVELVQSLSDWHKVRFEAAKAAAPYVHPKLTSVLHQGDETKPLVFSEVDKLEAAKRIALALTLSKGKK
jgi:hypothetical protein